MPKLLSEEQVARFRDDGYIGGIRVLSPGEAADILQALEDWERRSGKVAREFLRGKAHLLLKVLSDLTHHPKMVDAIEDVMGSDLLCIESGFFWKKARDPSYVTWHQDNSYLKLDPPVSLVTWVALTDSKRDNGALQVIPGTHRHGALPYDMVDGENNMLRFSREVRGIDSATAVTVELDAGEMSMHFNGVVHGSEPNTSDRPRVGWTVVCAPPHVRPGVEGFMSGTLLRGRNDGRIFADEPIPRFDFDPVSVEAYDRAMEGPTKIYKAK